jgi:hypothetical protein
VLLYNSSMSRRDLKDSSKKCRSVVRYIGDRRQRVPVLVKHDILLCCLAH